MRYALTVHDNGVHAASSFRSATGTVSTIGVDIYKYLTEITRNMTYTPSVCVILSV